LVDRWIDELSRPMKDVRDALAHRPVGLLHSPCRQSAPCGICALATLSSRARFSRAPLIHLSINPPIHEAAWLPRVAETD